MKKKIVVEVDGVVCDVCGKEEALPAKGWHISHSVDLCAACNAMRDIIASGPRIGWVQVAKAIFEIGWRYCPEKDGEL